MLQIRETERLCKILTTTDYTIEDIIVAGLNDIEARILVSQMQNKGDKDEVK